MRSMDELDRAVHQATVEQAAINVEARGLTGEGPSSPPTS